MSRRKNKPSSYYWLLALTLVMVIFGLIMVFSASSVRAYATDGDSFLFIKRHLVSVLVGFIGLVFFAATDFRKLRKISLILIIASLALLTLVLVFGQTAGGASRWFLIGGFSFQPSELAKFAIVLFTADVLTNKRHRIHNLKELLLPIGLIVGATAALVLAQPDLGTAFLICALALALMFLAGARLRHIVGMLVASAAAGLVFVFMETYRLRRLMGFLDPWADPQDKGFQLIQSFVAFGSGGWLGIGLGLSRQKFFYLPAAHTDFIFAIIGEELGLAGTLFVVAVFGTFAYFGFRVALRCSSFFGMLVAAGFVFLIVGQALINMVGVTGMFPVTGIPLPWLSYGGTSLIMTMCSVGVLLNVASQEKEKENYGGKNQSNNKRRGNRRPRLSGPGSRRSSARR